MARGASEHPGGPAQRPTFRFVGCTKIGWVAWALSLGLLWGQHRAEVQHPVVERQAQDVAPPT